MSAPAPVSETAVHIEIPGFQALSEQGHWDACSVVAEIDALHVCPWNGVPLAENSINAWRYQYVKYGHWRGNGCYLSDIYWHLTETPIHAPITGYIPYSPTPNLAALHKLLIDQASKQNPIIIQVANAAALPHAEQGVQYHFVAIGGIDSDLGYLIGNGDTTDALQKPPGAIVPCYWATWQVLVNAKICGAIAVERIVKPTTPPDPPETPIDTAKALQLAQQAQSTIDELVKVLGG